MTLTALDMEFSVCKLSSLASIPLDSPFFLLARTEEEISLVCESSRLPAGALAVQPGWRALKVAGPLDFDLVGILAQLTQVLATAGIPLFAVSTFNTDYILTQTQHFPRALQALRSAGHHIENA